MVFILQTNKTTQYSNYLVIAYIHIIYFRYNNCMHQNKIPLSYILATLYVGIAFIQASPQGHTFSSYTVLYPSLVLKGQLWRIFTYVFLHQGGMISLFFKALVAVFICSPLEAMWGRRFFSIVFWGSTILGGLTATIFGIPLYTGAFVSLSFFLIHGFTFPQSQIYLFFVIPVKIKYLAIFSTAMYLLGFASMGIVTGAGAMVGLLSGVGLWKLGLKYGWDNPYKKLTPKIPKKQSKEVKNKITSVQQTQQIINNVERDGQINPNELNIINNLDADTHFDGDLCAPFSFDSNLARCINCDGFKICLKRNALAQIEKIIKE